MGAQICKPSEEEFNNPSLWEFCGRQKEIKDILGIIKGKSVKTLCLHGPKHIGKTRVIQQVLMNEILNKYEQSCYVDFSDMYSDNNLDTEEFIKFLKEFFETLGIEMNDGLKSCGKCDRCSLNTGCSQILDKIIPKFLKLRQSCLLCFDNADMVLTSKFGKDFLNSLESVTNRKKNVKVIVGSTIRFHMSSRATNSKLLGPMEFQDLKDLLIQILKDGEDDLISNLNIEDPWLDAVVILCDGIPKCAETLGTILREDDGLIKPIELVQCLLTDFLRTLNPDLFPEEDRPAEKYQKELKKFGEIAEIAEQTWLYDIAASMKGSELLPDEGLEIVRNEGSQVGAGTFKMDGLRKYIDYSFLQKKDKTREVLSMERLYKHLLSNAYYLIKGKDGDGLNLKTFVGDHRFKLIHEEAKRIGLDLDHVTRPDALKIEQILNRRDQRLKREDSGRSSGEENDDDSGNSSVEEEKILEHHMTKISDTSDREAHSHDYSRFDSVNGPYAMSFINIEHGQGPSGSGTNDNGIDRDRNSAQKTTKDQFNHVLLDNDDTKDSETEVEFLRGNHIGGFEKEKGLSKSYPQTGPRQGLAVSGHQICVSHSNRMSSEDYDQDIENKTVDTDDSIDAKEQACSVTRDKQTCVRYSDSSTDSGEFKLGFERKPSPDEPDEM